MQQPLAGIEAPTIRVSAYDNPGAHGQTVSNALYGGRVINLQGSIRSQLTDPLQAVADYRVQRQALQQAVSLRQDPLGYPVTRLLQLSLGDGLTWQIPVITTKFIDPEMLPASSKWMLELTATQWYFEASSVTTASVGLPQPGGSSFPWSFPLSFSGGGGGSTTLTNTGNTLSYPVITILGPVINPVLTNATTGERLALTITLGSSDSLVIDTKAHTIIQGGATNRIGKLANDARFWGLTPGDNTITYSANQYDLSRAQLSWRTARLGL